MRWSPHSSSLLASKSTAPNSCPSLGSFPASYALCHLAQALLIEPHFLCNLHIISLLNSDANTFAALSHIFAHLFVCLYSFIPCEGYERSTFSNGLVDECVCFYWAASLNKGLADAKITLCAFNCRPSSEAKVTSAKSLSSLRFFLLLFFFI